jgi:addiction module HigA family antidote
MKITKPEAGWPMQRVTTHPGEILREDFLLPMGLTANQLATRTMMPPTRVGEILHARRSISPNTALRLARFFGTSPEFWLNLQASYDLSKARLELADSLHQIEPLSA